jgi:hypothetical protein
MPAIPALVGPSSTGDSRYADCERTVGFYLQKNDGPGAIAPWSLLPFPGLTSRAVAAIGGPGRALWAQDNRALRIASSRFYEVTSDYAHADKGGVAVDTNPAQMVSSGDAGGEVCSCSGGKVYIYNLLTNTLSAAIASLTGNQVGYLDGFFLALDQATSTLRISDLLNGLTWDPTQFVQRSTAPDRWQALLVCGTYIYLFGSETTDVLYDAGAFPFPFAVVAGGLILCGIAAPFSAADINGVPVWLARTADGQLSLVRGNGTGAPSRISTHAFEKALRGYGTVADAEASTFDYSGHSFYKLNFPTAGACWVYDDLTGALVEWPYWNAVKGVEEAHRANHHAYAFGKHFVDDRATGDLYTLDDGVWTDNGATRRWVRRFPFPVVNGGRSWITVPEFEVFCDVGIGNQNDPGSDPQMALRISRDAGNTWGNERTKSAGKVGKYGTRVRWQMLGRWRDGRGAGELIMTDPVRWQLHGGAFDPIGGTA